ncbi:MULTISPECIES: hypothetical protein [Acinetobacter]|uniref:Lipoprotein n=1 Tax=Acinetobacter baylyi (strain ATCC 33305 / BD413 / ADP1) TaxID=62977 RepID=Q6FEJ8_ACIAD|nr:MULTISPECIES: hypothetical protein [Acinetobacter]ENV52628.1 hypothetical protein F952_03026 [Acinetobacter baylyi DSM 14961 = CIP 107474]KAF2370061.1 hypothetical protein BSL88_13275 [Acinetobacter baylyi]KAF2375916.1 hypothetical protein BSL67_01160 [Acinetobacter baylyi]KAF2377474.1 hypothetical protein BSN81_08950 [Acinetobacter baylyi]KAF2383221.1 hypothetical protein BSN83_00340 [Acinetobacter baylyi]
MKLKLRDKDIRFLYYFFATMMIISLLAACYARLFQNGETLDLSAFYTFFVMMLFARFYYAIQYGLEKIEQINRRERQRQLDLEAKTKTQS